MPHAAGPERFSGFIVHSYPDLRRDRLYCLGRLAAGSGADQKSFAAIEETWRPYIHIFETDRRRVLPLLSGMRFEEIPAVLESFSGAEPLCCLRFLRYGDRARAAAAMENAAVPSPDADIKPADLFLMEKFIHGPVILRGYSRPGRRVDLVIREPEFSPPGPETLVGQTSLWIAAIDIETDVKSGCIRAVSAAWTSGLTGKTENGEMRGIVHVVSPNSISVDNIIFHDTEKNMLLAFMKDIHRIDPDVLTGWNFLDFDFPRLADRCAFHNIDFTLGRSSDPAKFFPGDPPGRDNRQWRRRSASAIVPGRQVLDALRIVRAGTWGSAGVLRDSGSDDAPGGFTLEAISQTVLGEGKAVSVSGGEKIAELDRLYAANPRRFGEYCLRDSELVLRILDRTGLFRLTLERASLTGVSLDKAWTSVVSFERVYGTELRRKGIAPPAPEQNGNVSGAAGGTVLEPLPGLFENVAVFDFRSLYPTIMRTFNIDPLAHVRVDKSAPLIVAPNGAEFSRSPGLLPSLIAGYFAARQSAIDTGDPIAAQVYKILMNSFYGVLGTAACRYGRTELAGSITSFARKWLLFSRDWFTAQGFRILYGDTDSLFVETGFGDTAAFAVFEQRCNALAREVNVLISQEIRTVYNLESFIELRFEKAYRRFLIPPLRNVHAASAEDSPVNRGRAKGYGGSLIHRPEKETGIERTTVEVKGMEAVRSDSTPLARRLQLELLDLVFSGGGETAFRAKVQNVLEEMRSGKLDSELIYRKRLARYPEDYTSSTPPQVKAARALGWKKQRGTVAYFWTVNGPEPAALLHGKLDYEHYAESQVFPLARSIAEAAHWDTNCFAKGRAGDFAKGQIEFTFG